MAAAEDTAGYAELLEDVAADPGVPAPTTCVDPAILDGLEREFHEFMQGIEEQEGPAPGEKGSLEICFANVPSTYYRFDGQTRNSAIFFSRKSFVQTLLEHGESSGIIGAMWILMHELGHYSLVTEEHEEMLPEDLAGGAAHLLQQLEQTDPTLLDGLYTTLRKDEFSDEAFADCFGAALLSTSFHDAYEHLHYGERSDLLRRVTQMAPNIADPGRKHGTQDERRSYVQYGLAIADAYHEGIDPLMESQIFLCSYRALEAGRSKAAGASAAMPAFDPAVGY